MITTLSKIRAHRPCTSGWQLLNKNLGLDYGIDTPLPISTILESNGLDDALWCLRAVENSDRCIRLLAVEYARSVEYLMTDQRSRDALDVAERHAYGLTTDVELIAAWDAARDAAWAAAGDAAKAVAWAAWAAAGDAAKAVAWAARDAARAAAGDAARDAARAAAGDAARAEHAILLALFCARSESGEFEEKNNV